jgi:AcrR family transcriptional regulator
MLSQSPASMMSSVPGGSRKNDPAPPRGGRYRSGPRRALHREPFSLDSLDPPQSAPRDRTLSHGSSGTDSNSIAKAAGYATGTFYKHFRDKRDIFLAAYERWVAAEWKEIGDELSRMQNAETTARLLVDLSVKFHTEWRGLRASLMELVFSDPEARKFFRAQRYRQLAFIVELRSRFALPARTREQDAIHLYMTERVFDAIGQGEIQSLSLDRDAVIESMVDKVHTLLTKDK